MTTRLEATNLNQLSADEVVQFEKCGHLSPVKILEKEQANHYRQLLETYEAILGHPVQGPQRTKPHLLFKWVDDLMRSSTILDCVEDLIGPDILCWNSWFWIKEAESDSYVSWHQDSQYWGLDTNKLVTAWLALSPATEASGCMRVIPGSHIGDPLKHQDLYHEDNMLTRGQEITGVDENAAISMPLETGEMSFHNVGIAHASGPNASSDRRIGLSFHYMPTQTRQLNAEWDCASLVRGEDRCGFFEHAPAPRYDLDPKSVDFHTRATDAMRAILFQDAEKIRPTI